jgi:hypothetical protein
MNSKYGNLNINLGGEITRFNNGGDDFYLEGDIIGVEY